MNETKISPLEQITNEKIEAHSKRAEAAQRLYKVACEMFDHDQELTHSALTTAAAIAFSDQKEIWKR